MGDGDEFLRFFLKFAGCQGDIFWNIYANCQKFMIFNSITKAYYYSIVNCREGTYVGRIVLRSSWCILPLFNHQWHTDFLYCYSKVNDNVAVKVEIISNINIIITSKYFLKHNISGEDGMRRISQSTQLRYKMRASFCQYQTTTFHVTNIKNWGN